MRDKKQLMILVTMMLSIGSSFGISLIERSPFIGPNFNSLSPEINSPESPVVQSDYEFHGVYVLGENTHVLLKTRKDGKLRWYQVGTGKEGIFPKLYDGEDDRLYLEVGNTEIYLELEEMGEFKSIPISGANPRAVSTGSARTFPTTRGPTSSTTRSPIRRSPTSRSPIGSASSRSAGGRSSSAATTAEQRAQLIALWGSQPAQPVPTINNSSSGGLDSAPSNPPRGKPNLPSNMPSPPPPP